MSNSSVGPMDRTLSGATYPGQREPGRDDDVGIFHIPQGPSVPGVSPSDCLVAYSERS